MMNQVISKFLQDHKSTCIALYADDKTRAIMNKLHENKWINRLDTKILKPKKTAVGQNIVKAALAGAAAAEQTSPGAEEKQ